MARFSFSYTHGDQGSKPNSSLDFQQNERPDAQNFDWWWYNVITAINDHASALDTIDSDDDGTVDAADTAGDADTVDGKHYTDIQSWVSSYYLSREYNPEPDTHDRYQDSEAIAAVDGEVDQSGSVATLDDDVASLQNLPHITKQDALDKINSEINTAASSVSTLDTTVEGKLDKNSKYTDSDAVDAINNDADHASTAQHNYYTDSDAKATTIQDQSHWGLNLGYNSAGGEVNVQNNPIILSSIQPASSTLSIEDTDNNGNDNLVVEGDLSVQGVNNARYTNSEAISAINNDDDHSSTASHNYYTDSDAEATTIKDQSHWGLNISYNSAGDEVNVKNSPILLDTIQPSGTTLYIEDTDNNGNDNLIVEGNFTTQGNKNFVIDHPSDPEGKDLRHASYEGPNAGGIIYRDTVTVEDGTAVPDFPDYVLNGDFGKDWNQQATPCDHFGAAYVDTDEWVVHADQDGKYDVMVTGERTDDGAQSGMGLITEKRGDETWDEAVERQT